MRYGTTAAYSKTKQIGGGIHSSSTKIMETQ